MADDANDVAVETSEPAVDAPAAEEEKKEEPLDFKLDIADAGACRKHLKVSVPRSEVDRFINKEFSDLVKNAAVPGFRPGKTPRKLVERRFEKEVSDQVKASLLYKSLEQIDKEDKVQPLAQPEIDIKSIELPEEGDFVYEFDVEVRPEFDVPNYKDLKIQRPVKKFTDQDVEEGLHEFLRQRGKLEEKDGAVEKGDYADIDARFMNGKEVIRELSDVTVRVDEALYFRDGHIEKFAEGMLGARAGDAREFVARLAETATREDLRNKDLTAVIVVKYVKHLVIPELDDAFFTSIGVTDGGELRDLIREQLERRLEYAQRQSAREQLVGKLLENATWDLPRDLLKRMAEGTLQKKLVEMERAGFDEDEIRGKLNRLRQESVATTARYLKEQFMLQKIAQLEGIKIEEQDLEDEIRQIARENHENPRRVRARVEKDQLWEAIANQALENKTIAKILTYATVEDVEHKEEAEPKTSGLDESAVPEPPPAPEPAEAAESAT